MVVNKRKKASRQHGSTTHGWGSMKKHRGAGNKGGTGNAGTGKRADSKKPSIWKDKSYFGKRGFKKKGQKVEINPINLDTVDQMAESYVKGNHASRNGGFYVIDLSKLGFNKLLGDGKVLNKLDIKVLYASAKAVEKINSAGGKIEILSAKKTVKISQE